MRSVSSIKVNFLAFFSIFGAYAVSSNLFDVWVMFASALLAIGVGTVGIPILPIVLAFILGGVLEQNVAITAARAGGIGYFLERPIAMGLAALTVAIIAVVIWRAVRRLSARSEATEALPD